MMECPYCHCDNQDMLVGMGENMLLCTACDKEFSELDVIERKEPRTELQTLTMIAETHNESLRILNNTVKLLGERVVILEQAK